MAAGGESEGLRDTEGGGRGQIELYVIRVDLCVPVEAFIRPSDSGQNALTFILQEPHPSSGVGTFEGELDILCP